MVRSLLTVWMCLMLTAPATAQEEGEEAPADQTAGDEAAEDEAPEETTEEAPPAPAAEGEPAADSAEEPTAEPATEQVEEPTADEGLSLSWEEAWDGGFALYREGRYAEAIPFLERALSLEAADPTVRAYLAECYRRTGDLEQAAELTTAAAETAAATDAETTGEAAVPERRPKGPFTQPVRAGRHFGLGVTLAGNALSVGFYVEVEPIPYLDFQGGLGLGDLHTLFWWVQGAVLPLDMAISPSVGVGVLGTMGLDFHVEAYMPRGMVDYYMNRVNPYVHVGVVLVTRPGFSGAFELNGIFTGDPTFPIAPWVGVRFGFLI